MRASSDRAAAWVVSVLCLLAAASRAEGHGGGLDGYGCHHNRKAGGYHCHRGPLAGQSFSSQDEMRKQLTPGLQPYSEGVEAARPKNRSSTSVEQRLQRLESLRKKGLVTEDEYAEKRRQILDDL